MDKLDANAILNMEIEAKLQKRVEDLVFNNTQVVEQIIYHIRNHLVNDRDFAIKLQKTMASVIQNSQLY